MKKKLTILFWGIMMFGALFGSSFLVGRAETPEEEEKVVVALDPGHDLKHGGAAANSLQEHILTMKLALYCKAELESHGNISVYLTRTGEYCPYPDQKKSGKCIEQRVLAAKSAGAGLYVSLHINAEENGTSANGVEVIYPNNSWKPLVGAEGQALAQSILNELVAVGLSDRGIYTKNTTVGETYADGSVSDYFAVQIYGKESSIPGVIVEHGYITNPWDVSNFLNNDAGLKKLGTATAQGIYTYLQQNNGWKWTDGAWYYYKNGVRETGWFLENDTWYFLGDDGAMLTSWQYIGTKWYYLDNSGAMLTGWQTIDGKEYRFGDNGALFTGWQLIDGKWHYFGQNGIMSIGWEVIGGVWYYFDASGVMQTDWKSINGTWYYFGDSGAMHTEWAYINNAWYYFDANGKMQTGWICIEEAWYYLNENGAMQVGWKNIGGTEYLFDASGRMVEGAKGLVLDISKWQGKIDWSKVANTNVKGVIVRSSHGDETTEQSGNWKDIRFAEYIAALEQYKIPYGIYHYNTATTVEQARVQAQNTVEIIRATNANPTFPVFVDIEQDAGNCDLIAIAKVYIEVFAMNGYKPGIYANTNYWMNYLNDPIFNMYYRWIANYGTTANNLNATASSTFAPKDGVENYMMWQYTSRGEIDGITENTVDCNVLYEWYQKPNGWKVFEGEWFYYDDGYLAAGWKYINNHWYYFDGKGAMQTGWQYISGKWFYLDDSGVMQTGWKIYKGEWYYLKDNGAMATDWEFIDSTWYCFNSSGVMITGWQMIDGFWCYFDGGVKTTNHWVGSYYLDEKGQMVTNAWVDNGRYYVGDNGAYVSTSGWFYLGGSYYYLSAGLKQTGWVQAGGAWYYMNPETGIMLSDKWLDDTYYLTASGAMATGWLKLGETWYYMNSSGAKVTNQWVGNYYLQEDGTMATNKWIGKYYVGANGSWIL